jgi:membrane-bound lytic murein transglycosylase A
VRVACVVVLLLAGTANVHAQSMNLDGIDVTRRGLENSSKTAKIADRSASLVTPGKRLGSTADPVNGVSIGPLSFESFKIPSTQLETVSWSALSGWTSDDHSAAFEAFALSCKPIIRGKPSKHASQPFYAALQSVCRRAVIARPHDSTAARIFFEQNFRPMRIARLGESNGLLTGYYEPIIAGSRVATAKFKVPIYRKPPDFAQRGNDPYYDRAAIEEGVLAGRNLEIAWLEDATDLLFAEMEGSVRIKLEDGTVLRLNYDGHNGWPYTSIEQILIERKVMPKEKMSTSRIRDWMKVNPEEGKELRRRNKSFVFFRETGLGELEEAIGAQGISLTPGRSIAVDKFIHIYGTPFFIEAELPIQNKSSSKFQRLMVSQDTGGAIRGPARADLYFGAGEESAQLAGRVRHPGQFTMLIPREIDPVIAGAQMPLPRMRPLFGKIEKAPAKRFDKLLARAKNKGECERQREQVQISTRSTARYSKQSTEVSPMQSSTQQDLVAC